MQNCSSKWTPGQNNGFTQYLYASKILLYSLNVSQVFSVKRNAPEPAVSVKGKKELEDKFAKLSQNARELNNPTYICFVSSKAFDSGKWPTF